MSNTPKNCNECQYTQCCDSYYGGAACKHKKQIIAKGKKK